MLNEQFEHQNAANLQTCCTYTVESTASSTKMLQIPWKTKGSELKHAANTAEMAASRSKMVQIARKMESKKENRTENKNHKRIPDPQSLHE